MNARIVYPGLLAVVVSLLVSSSVFAATSCGGVETSIIACSSGAGGGVVWTLLEIVINVLAGLVGIAAVGGLVYGAILYTSAGDTAGQITKAKTTIASTVLGLVLFAGMYSFLQYLIPGGIFDRTYTTPVATDAPSKSSGSSDKEDPKGDTKIGIITHLHSSGRFDRSLRQWKSDLQAIDRQHTPSIITLTETGSGRDKVVDWSGWSHTKGESIIAWKTSVWRKISTTSQELAPNTPSRLRSTVRIVALEHRVSKTKWLWAVTHVPAHVDGGNGRFRTYDPDYTDEHIRSQVTKWKAVIPHLATIVNNSAKKYSVKRLHSVVTADWNVNLAQKGWRDRMKGYFPNYKPSNPVGSRGTHGNRTIDASLVANEMAVTSWRGLGQIASSDHKPFVVRYNPKD